MNYSIEECRDSVNQPYFIITAKGRYVKFLPRDNEFRDKTAAEEWINKRIKKDVMNLRSNVRNNTMRSIGLVKTPYGWE